MDILFTSDDYVAINKPAGLAAIPGRGETTCAVEQVAARLHLPWSGSADPRVRLVHRIDKETSGVLLFALHREAQRHASHQFQNNSVSKEYLALVAGQPDATEGTIDVAIGPHPANPKLMSVLKHGRPALTNWRLEQRFRHYALLKVMPRTGKTHQIRVHLRSVGLPLAIDELYNPAASRERPGIFLSSFKHGYKGSSEEERPLIARLTLHAARLTFASRDGQPLEFIAPLPKDLRAVLNSLAKYGS